MSVDWALVADSLSAIGTIAAVVVALYLAGAERRLRARERPQLKMGFRPTEPDCGPIWKRGSPESFYGEKVAEAFWFRAYVENVGVSAARELEVQIHDVVKRGEDGLRPVPDFIQGSLAWTHQRRDEVFLPLLLPGTAKHFELAVISEPAHPSRPTSFDIQMVASPANEYNKLPVGQYEFDVTVGAANASTARRRFRLSFSGGWHNTAAVMFRECCRLELVDSA